MKKIRKFDQNFMNLTMDLKNHNNERFTKRDYHYADVM